jgi:hypothetical protein
LLVRGRHRSVDLGIFFSFLETRKVQPGLFKSGLEHQKTVMGQTSTLLLAGPRLLLQLTVATLTLRAAQA